MGTAVGVPLSTRETVDWDFPVTALDVVSGRQRSGQHSVEHVVSYEVRGGELVEVSQRNVNARH